MSSQVGVILSLEGVTARGRKAYPLTVLNGQSHHQEQPQILARDGRGWNGVAALEARLLHAD